MIKKKWIVIALLVLMPVGVYTLAAPRVLAFLKERRRTHFSESEVTRGDIVSVINSTGTVQPTLRVQVGTFVSGPITKLLVDFNDHVNKGQLLARIDPRIYKTAVARDEASLATAVARVAKTEALLEQACNDEKRAKALRAINENIWPTR